jgi:phage tail protein X
MAFELIPVTQEHVPLDLILWRRFKREVPGLVEKTLELNQNLADGPVYLPVGTLVKVELPAPAPRGRSAVRVIALYD